MVYMYFILIAFILHIEPKDKIYLQPETKHILLKFLCKKKVHPLID